MITKLKITACADCARSGRSHPAILTENTRRLNFIQRAKALGFSSEQVRELLDLHVPGDNHTRAAVKSLTASHIDAIADKIRDLQRIKGRLSVISSYCDGSAQSADTCPILESLFEDS